LPVLLPDAAPFDAEPPSFIPGQGAGRAVAQRLELQAKLRGEVGHHGVQLRPAIDDRGHATG
jgi:hypothetical protein